MLTPATRAALLRAAYRHGRSRKLRERAALERCTPAVVLVDGIELGVLVGRALRAARLARGLTQHDVARAMGSHRPVIARTERGLHVPKLDVIVRHMTCVGLTLADLGAILDASAV